MHPITRSCACFCFALILLFTSAGLQKPVEAQALAPQECTPLDVIFVLDEDPELVSWAADFLALQSLTTCNGTHHQMAVLQRYPHDGDNVYLPLTPLNPSSLSAWQSERQSILASINEPMDIYPTSLAALFQQAGELAAGGRADATKLVIYIGAPYEAINSSSNEYALRNQIANIQNTYMRASGAASDESIQLWTLFFFPGSYRDIYRDWTRPHWDDFTAEANGRAMFNLDEDKPHQYSNAVMDIMATAGGLPGLLPFSCGGYEIDPYQGTLLTVTFADDENLQVTVEHENPDGSQTSMTNGEGPLEKEVMFLSNGEWRKNNVLVITDPPGGLWRVSAGSQCDGMAGFTLGGKVNAAIGGIEHDIPQYNLEGLSSDPDQPFIYTLTLSDGLTGEPVQFNPQALPQVDMEITLPDGSRRAIFFKLDAAGLMVSEAVPVPLAGDYHWQADVSLPVSTGNSNTSYIPMFTGLTGGYSVYAISNLSLVPLLPEDKEYQVHQPLLKDFFNVKPMEVAVQLVDMDTQQAVDPALVFDQPDQALEVWLESKTGETSQKVILRRDSDSPMRYIGEVGGDFDMNGAQKGWVEVVGAYDQVNYRIAKKMVSAPFTRQDGFLSSPWTWTVLSILMGLAVLGYIGYRVSLFINPLAGQLVISAAGVNRPVANIRLVRQRELTYRQGDLVRISPLLKGMQMLQVRRVSDDRIFFRMTLDNGNLVKANLGPNESATINNIMSVRFILDGNPNQGSH